MLSEGHSENMNLIVKNKSKLLSDIYYIKMDMGVKILFHRFIEHSGFSYFRIQPQYLLNRDRYCFEQAIELSMG